MLCGDVSQRRAPPSASHSYLTSWHPAEGPGCRQVTGLAVAPGSQLVHPIYAWASRPLAHCLWLCLPSVTKPLYLKIKCLSTQAAGVGVLSAQIHL